MARNILIVEDEALIAMNEARMLEKHGYDTETVYTGEKAIEKVKADSSFTLILMDIDLGRGMDGTEAAQRILDNHDIPIVFLSSHTEPEIVEKTEGITSYGYIVKNSGETVLLASIKMAFRLYDAHMELKTQKENLRTALIDKEYAEEELLKKNAELDRYFNSSLDMLCIANTKGEFIRLNPEWEKALGYSLEELRGSSFMDFVHEDDREATLDAVSRLEKQEEVIDFENRFMRKDGSFRWIEWRSKSMGSSIYAAARDVTDRKEAEHTMKASEEKLRTTLNSIGDAVISTDTQGLVVRMNPVAEKLSGWSLDEAAGRALSEVFHIVNAHSGKTVENPVGKVLKTGKVVGLANHTVLISKDNSTYQIADSASPIKNDHNQTTGVVLVFRDVTEQYKKDRELQESEKKYHDLVENSPVGIFQTDSNGHVLHVNPAMAHMVGAQTTQEAIENYQELSAQLYVRPERRKEFIQLLREHGEVTNFEYEAKPLTNERRWFSMNARISRTFEDGSFYIDGFTADITTRKLSEEKYKEYIAYAPHGLIVMTSWGDIQEVNAATSQITGYSYDELLKKNVTELAASDEQDTSTKAFQTIHRDGCMQTDMKITTREGKQRILTISGVKLSDGRILSFGEDITQRKEYERLNAERKHYMEAILAAAPNAVLTLDTVNRIKEWNPGAEKLFHYTQDEAYERDLDELLSGNRKPVYDEALSLTQQVSNGLPVPPTETVRYTKEGEPINVIVAGSPIIVDGSFTGIVATYTDITRLKQKEAEVESLLEEKEQLLKEVHHRVKNHMSTISSIVSLRNNSTDNPEVRSVLQEIHNKIKLMQNIYQTLYTRENVSTVRITSFLDQLITDIRSTYPQSPSITIETKIEDLKVSSKQSLPIGIIITELITNAIKYAFENRDGGRITISIYTPVPEQLTIEVADDGKGIPQEIFQNETYGFGLTLVQGYVQQFNGDMRIDNTAGTTISIRMELEQ